MSQALFEQTAGSLHSAASAGTEPAGQVHPEVVQVIAEMGLDLSDNKPQRLTTELAEAADVVVTMGCGDACPFIPGKRYIDWDLPDPSDKSVDEVRQIRNEIVRRVQTLLDHLDAASSGGSA